MNRIILENINDERQILITREQAFLDLIKQPRQD